MYTNKNYNQAKKEVPQRNKRWSEISGEMRIFKKEFDNYNLYSTTISRKSEDGEWVNVYIPVKGKKLDDIKIPANGELAKVKGFWSLNFYKDKVEPVIVLTDIQS